MRRTTTTDAGCRYLCRLPFAGELQPAEREGVQTALETAAFERRHEYGVTGIDTHSVDVTAEEAHVTVELSTTADHTPADVLGRLSRAIGEWRNREGGITAPARAGGEQSINTLDAASLGVNREPATTGSIHSYVLVYPERPLTAEECDLVDYVTDDTTVVDPSYVAFIDAVSPARTQPATRVLADLRERLKGHVDAGHDLRTRGWFATREIGTLAVVDDTTREILHQRGQQHSPHASEDVDAPAAVESR